MQIGDHSKLVENSENPQFGQISDQQRLANFVSLRNLENQLSPEMFEQVVKQVSVTKIFCLHAFFIFLV